MLPKPLSASAASYKLVLGRNAGSLKQRTVSDITLPACNFARPDISTIACCPQALSMVRNSAGASAFILAPTPGDCTPLTHSSPFCSPSLQCSGDLMSRSCKSCSSVILGIARPTCRAPSNCVLQDDRAQVARSKTRRAQVIPALKGRSTSASTRAWLGLFGSLSRATLRPRRHNFSRPAPRHNEPRPCPHATAKLGARVGGHGAQTRTTINLPPRHPNPELAEGAKRKP